MNNKPHLSINLLGTVSIKLNGTPVTDITSRTAIAILIYLIHYRRPILPETLADFFWDGRSQKQAGANLRSALSRLRRKFPDYLNITRESVAFNHDLPYQIDALALEQALEKLLKKSQPDITAIEESLSLYHGDFLAGFYVNESEGFNNWSSLHREKLRRLTAIALQKVTEHHLENGSYLHGIPFGERWIRIDPLHELAYQQVMWLLARVGRRHEALQKYEECRHLLQKELALPPSPVTNKLQQRIRELIFPPPLQLPAFASPFIGRTSELNKLTSQLLATDCPILTILGMGGTGKSRLAVQAVKRIAHQRPGRFLDGIFFVALATVNNGSELVTKLIDVFDLKVSAKNSSAQLVTHLADQEMLLVLDNFEHLAEDASALNFLSQLTTSNTNTRLLITSRQRLFLQAEQIFSLSGLSYPQMRPTQGLKYEAGELFLDRTRRIRGNALLAKEEMLAIWRICRAVEGSPIAIEMAAGSMWKMPATEIADQIQTNMTKLVNPMWDVPSRHRSVYVVLNYSWQLLLPHDRQTLARLTVFPADFDAIAAQEITECSVELLLRLSARSLLRQMDNGRFDLHPLVREFAIDKLAEYPQESSQTAEKHARYFSHFIRTQGEQFAAGKQKEALQTITRELDNLRTMWHWITQHKQFATLRRVADLLQQYFEIKGWFADGRDLFAAAIHAIQQEIGKEAAISKAYLLTYHGAMLHRMSDYAGARQSLERALQLLEMYDAYCDTSLALGHLSHVTDHLGDSKASLQYIESGLVVARACDVAWEEAAFLNSLGVYHLKSGAYRSAVAYFQEAAVIQRTIKNWQWLAISLCNLGQCLIALGACEEAYDRLEAADEIAQRINYQVVQSDIEINKGWVAYLQGDFSQAERHVAAALAIAEEKKWQQRIAEAHNLAGMIALNQADFANAKVKFQQSLHAFQLENYAPGIAEANAHLGLLTVMCEEVVSARNYLQKAVKIALEIENSPIIPHLLVGTAQLAAHETDWETAVSLTAIVKSHPITTEYVRRQAQQYWEQLTAQLLPEMLTQIESDIGSVDLETVLLKAQQWLNCY